MLYWLLIALVTLSFFTGEILSLLNDSVHRTDIDPRVADFYDAEKYRRSLAYKKDKAGLSRAMSAFSFLLTVGFLATGTFGRIDGLFTSLIGNPRLRAMAFFWCDRTGLGPSVARLRPVWHL